MAKQEEATLVLKVKDSGSAEITKMSGLFSRFVITAGDVVNGIKAIGRSAIEFAQLASQSKTVEIAFKNLAANQGQDANEMLSNMRRLSAGTVADLELMKNANQALLLGLPIERFGDMLEIARSSAKATGQSMDFMLNSIVVGLGRGSKLMLDNLGILVDTNAAYDKYAVSVGKTAEQLTEAEKKTAFINEALRVGKENADAAGASSGDLNEKWAQLTTIGSNLAIQVGSFLLPALVSLTSAAVSAAKAFQYLFPEKVIETSQVFDRQIDQLQDKLIRLKMAIQDVRGGVNFDKNMLEMQVKRVEEELKAVQAKRDEYFTREMAQMEAQAAQRAQMEAEAERTAAEERAVAREEARLTADQLEFEHLEAKGSKQLEIQMRQLDLQYKAAQSNGEKLRLLRQKSIVQDQLQEMQAAEAQKKLEEKRSKEQIADREKTYATIATLTQSNNKILVTIGRAAALAQIYMSTSEGVARALGAFPPPVNFAMAAAVGAAGAVQASKVMGVQLAEGGIVQASNGGTQATIGEGGRDEAVIPLPKDFDPDRGMGGGSTFVFNGPLMGDKTQAREFATMIDEELLRLRQRNESVSFDKGVF